MSSGDGVATVGMGEPMTTTTIAMVLTTRATSYVAVGVTVATTLEAIAAVYTCPTCTHMLYIAHCNKSWKISGLTSS